MMISTERDMTQVKSNLCSAASVLDWREIGHDDGEIENRHVEEEDPRQLVEVR